VAKWSDLSLPLGEPPVIVASEAHVVVPVG